MGCDTMLELGVLVGGATIVALLILSPIFRQPVPPRWTQNGFISEVVTVALVAGFALGVVLIVAGAIELAETGFNFLHLGSMAGAIAVLALAWRWLRQRQGAARGSGRLPTGTA
jgi:hypothetical protein